MPSEQDSTRTSQDASAPKTAVLRVLAGDIAIFVGAVLALIVLALAVLGVGFLIDALIPPGLTINGREVGMGVFGWGVAGTLWIAMLSYGIYNWYKTAVERAGERYG